MSDPKIKPETITSPIQLMAAWFVMLVLLVSIILTAAINIKSPDWAAGYLVIFSSIMILTVIACVTLMLTLFRPHLQEGKEYAQWLRDKAFYSKGLIDTDQLNAGSTTSGKPTKISNKSPVKSLYKVSVSNAPNAFELVASLQTAGFRSSIYGWTSSEDSEFDKALDRQEAIWVGVEVPAEVAVECIKIALTIWPHLKYMELSNDGATPPAYVHREIYLGGASSTAEERGLLPWSKEELVAIKDDIGQSELHNLIRSKYP